MLLTVLQFFQGLIFTPYQGQDTDNMIGRYAAQIS